MKVVIAIDSFKGCLTSAQAGDAVRKGVLESRPSADATVLPVSDGGEGMLEAFTAAIGGHIVEIPVHDPLMRPITARYGLSCDGTTAIVEMAQASGLTLLSPSERNPLRTSSFGTGELISHAVGRGCRRVVVGLGGSATSDAGKGMLRALGAVITDNGIDTSRFVLNSGEVEVVVASDVLNPLYGPEGAAHVFAPQKGATPEMVEELDAAARRFAALTARHVGHDHSTRPGAGAAGGLGFALMAYTHATVRSGADLLLDLAEFDTLAAGAYLVVTGEGSADHQTLMGKLPYRVMCRAVRLGVPTALLAGRVANRDQLLEAGFAAVECINPAGQPLDISMQPDVARGNITATTARIVRKII